MIKCRFVFIKLDIFDIKEMCFFIRFCCLYWGYENLVCVRGIRSYKVSMVYFFGVFILMRYLKVKYCFLFKIIIGVIYYRIGYEIRMNFKNKFFIVYYFRWFVLFFFIFWFMVIVFCFLVALVDKV